MKLTELIIERAMEKVASRMEKEAGFGAVAKAATDKNIQNHMSNFINDVASRGLWFPGGLIAKGVRGVRNAVKSSGVNQWNPLKAIDNVYQKFYDTPYKQNMMKATVGPAPSYAEGEYGMVHNNIVGVK